MKVLFGTLIVCVVLFSVAMIGMRLRKARSIETEVALTIEADYRAFSSTQPPETLSSASRIVDILSMCLGPNSQTIYSSPELNKKVAVARGLAISNLVTGLETFSGMNYGTNIQAWENWLKTKSTDGAVKEGAVK